MPVSEGVRALEAGTAFAPLPDHRSVAVTGGDAVSWLNDLVTNRVDDIGPNELRRTLFLDRTGRVRADVHVGTTTDRDGTPAGLLILQDGVQPKQIETLLGPYVLSSDVELSPGPDLAIVVVPGDIASVQFMAWPGPDDRIGHTLMARGEVEPAREALRGGRGIVEATRTDAEVFRIRRGVPRFGVDFGDDWLPAEAGLDDLVDTTKGCFLGQESVAKVRNLGHPPRVIQSFAASDPLTPMAPIVADGERVGRITSVALNDDGSTACIGWVRWDARDAQVAAENGLLLTRRSAA